MMVFRAGSKKNMFPFVAYLQDKNFEFWILDFEHRDGVNAKYNGSTILL